jgi:tRNA A37 threonylcarbamoyladenosine modification protein TsaB
VFTLVDAAPAVAAPAELRIEPGTTCVGDGAVRYRDVLEALGAEVPPRESELHLPRARFHVELARAFVDPETVEPLYLRLPDAERAQ